MKKSAKILIAIILLMFIGMNVLDIVQDKIHIFEKGVYFIFSLSLCLILILLIIIFCIICKKGREILFDSFIYIVLFAGILVIFGLVFIRFVGELTILTNNTYDLGKGNWLSYFGAVFGACVTVIGAYFLTQIQTNSDKKQKIKTNSVLLLNDLNYLNSRIKDYVRLIDENTNNENFYRIRYLNVNDNWRELVAFLFQNRIFEDKDVTWLYNFFTDIYFITEKSIELQELSNNELNLGTQQKDSLKKRKKQIKESINKKYKEIHNNNNITNIISKLNDRL